ncbi:MAG: hypothetical protein ACE5I2_11250 [Anaerolineae bacterium]
MDNERGLEALSWEELEQAVEQFIAADGPNTDTLPADVFFILWAQFEVERRRRVIEVEGEIVGEEVHLTLAPSSVGSAEVKGHEIRLPDGTRIVLRLRSAQSTAV